MTASDLHNYYEEPCVTFPNILTYKQKCQQHKQVEHLKYLSIAQKKTTIFGENVIYTFTHF